MTTISDLQEYANKKNLKFETYSHICHNKFYNSQPEYILENESHKEYSTTYFGLQTSIGIWYWFKKSNRHYNNNNDIMFYQRYSQKTGKIVKGFLTGFNLTDKIENFLNK